VTWRDVAVRLRVLFSIAVQFAGGGFPDALLSTRSVQHAVVPHACDVRMLFTHMCLGHSPRRVVLQLPNGSDVYGWEGSRRFGVNGGRASQSEWHI